MGFRDDICVALPYFEEVLLQRTYYSTTTTTTWLMSSMTSSRSLLGEGDRSVRASTNTDASLLISSRIMLTSSLEYHSSCLFAAHGKHRCGCRRLHSTVRGKADLPLCAASSESAAAAAAAVGGEFDDEKLAMVMTTLLLIIEVVVCSGNWLFVHAI